MCFKLFCAFVTSLSCVSCPLNKIYVFFACTGQVHFIIVGLCMCVFNHVSAAVYTETRILPFQASPIEINGRQIYVEERKPNSGIRGGSKLISSDDNCALFAFCLHSPTLTSLSGNENCDGYIFYTYTFT